MSWSVLTATRPDSLAAICLEVKTTDAYVPNSFHAVLLCCCLRRRLPGIIDCILSGLWSLFFLATGGALAAYREFACATFSSYYW